MIKITVHVCYGDHQRSVVCVGREYFVSVNVDNGYIMNISVIYGLHYIMCLEVGYK